MSCHGSIFSESLNETNAEMSGMPNPGLPGMSIVLLFLWDAEVFEVFQYNQSTLNSLKFDFIEIRKLVLLIPQWLKTDDRPNDYMKNIFSKPGKRIKIQVGE